MRVLVCGGRDFSDFGLLTRVLDGLRIRPTEVVHGRARGADSLAAKWAHLNGIKERPFPADWEKYGRSAGMIRNKQMLVEGRPDLVVVFPGGRGTDHMRSLAEKHGYPVKVIDEEN